MPDDVDSRDLEIAHALEEIAVGDGELRQDLLVLDVRLILEIVGGAPLGSRGEEILAEKVGPYVAIVRIGAMGRVQAEGRGGRPAPAAAPGDLDRGDRRHVGSDIVTLPRLKLRGEIGRPWVEPVGGLVAAKAEDGLAEFIADSLLVGLIGPVDEKLSRLGIQVVHQGVFAVLCPGLVVGRPRHARAKHPVRQRDGPMSRRRGGPADLARLGLDPLGGAGIEIDGHGADCLLVKRAGKGLSGSDLHLLGRAKGFHVQIGTLHGELSPGKAGRIAAVVVEPEVHVALLRLFDADFYVLEEGGGQVGRLRVSARLDKRGMKIHRPDAVEVAGQNFPGEDAIPAPGYLGTVGGRRRREIRDQLRDRGIAKLLPGAVLRREAGREQEWQEDSSRETDCSWVHGVTAAGRIKGAQGCSIWRKKLRGLASRFD